MGNFMIALPLSIADWAIADRAIADQSIADCAIADQPITDYRSVLCPLPDYPCRLPIADVFAIAHCRFHIAHCGMGNIWRNPVITSPEYPASSFHRV